MKKNKQEENSRIIIGRGEKIFLVINNCIMVLLMLVTLYPMLYVLFASLSDPIELGKATGLLWKPAGFSLRGYASVLGIIYQKIFRRFKMTMTFRLCSWTNCVTDIRKLSHVNITPPSWV